MSYKCNSELVSEVWKLEQENTRLKRQWSDLKEFIENHRYGPIRQNRHKILSKMNELEK